MICFYDATSLNKVPQVAVVYNATRLNELERRATIVAEVDQTTVSIKVFQPQSDSLSVPDFVLIQ